MRRPFLWCNPEPVLEYIGRELGMRTKALIELPEKIADHWAARVRDWTKWHAGKPRLLFTLLVRYAEVNGVTDVFRDVFDAMNESAGIASNAWQDVALAEPSETEEDVPRVKVLDRSKPQPAQHILAPQLFAKTQYAKGSASRPVAKSLVKAKRSAHERSASDSEQSDGDSNAEDEQITPPPASRRHHGGRQGEEKEVVSMTEDAKKGCKGLILSVGSSL